MGNDLDSTRPYAERSWDDDSVEVAWVAKRAGHVSKAVKGLLVALAAALALELTVDAGAAALGLAGTVLAVLFGNLYGDAMQRELQTGRRTGRAELRALTGHSVGIPLGATPAFVLFVLAWLRIISTELAIDAAIWSGIGLLFALGYASGRIQGDVQTRAVLHGLVLAVIGLGPGRQVHPLTTVSDTTLAT